MFGIAISFELSLNNEETEDADYHYQTFSNQKTRKIENRIIPFVVSTFCIIQEAYSVYNHWKILY